MNEKTAKKIGEAHAFAQTLLNTHTKVPTVMQELLGEHAAKIESVAEAQKNDLDAVLKNTEHMETVHTKSEKTVTKIATMADTYVGDEWDNPVEVLEWMSFFLGAALIHWQLIHGSAEELGMDDLIEVTKKGVAFYEELLAEIRKTASKIGHERAAA